MEVDISLRRETTTATAITARLKEDIAVKHHQHPISQAVHPVLLPATAKVSHNINRAMTHTDRANLSTNPNLLSLTILLSHHMVKPHHQLTSSTALLTHNTANSHHTAVSSTRTPTVKATLLQRNNINFPPHPQERTLDLHHMAALHLNNTAAIFLNQKATTSAALTQEDCTAIQAEVLLLHLWEHTPIKAAMVVDITQTRDTSSLNDMS